MIGFICGAWDLLHVGHVQALSYVKSKCDLLIVGLQVDPSVDRKTKHKPIQSVYERWYQLNQCRSVDTIIPYETEEDLINLLRTNNIDIRFLGEDYLIKSKEITAKDLIPIEYIPRKHTYSTSELRERVKNG